MSGESVMLVGKRPNPWGAGLGLRAQHYRDVLEQLPDVGWFEVHSENYFGDGGRPLDYLQQIAAHYPLSLHGVGLSIGSTDPLSSTHLNKLKSLIHRFEPALVSEHLSWGSVGGRYFNDLLPLPYTEEALDHMVARVQQVQDYLGRQLLIENVSSYLQYQCSTIPEWEFLTELARRTGCGLLLDINNIYVNSRNHQFNPESYIDAIAADTVQEIHLAGHTVKQLEQTQILIDTHDACVSDAVWALYRKAARRFTATAVLIEWDSNIPPFSVLLNEAAKAREIFDSANGIQPNVHIA